MRLDHERAHGPALEVAYEPLAAPFALTGLALSYDEPVQIQVSAPRRGVEGAMVTTRSGEDGTYRFETTDPAQRYSWCRWSNAEATDPTTGVPARTYLMDRGRPERCGELRRLPDFRFGTEKAVTGFLGFVAADAYRPAFAGEAKVTLLWPADSTEVAPPVETLDDGSFHIWYPVELSETTFPECDLLLSVDIEDGRSLIVPMLPSPQDACRADVYRYLEVR